MRVLLVEDNEEKARQIVEIVEGTGVAKADIISVRGLRAAYPAIQRGGWRLIILDMTLHAAEGAFSASSKESLAGIEVLQALQARGDTTPVIVATQHDVFEQDFLYFPDVDALDTALQEAFPFNYRGTVRVRLGSEPWRIEMRRRIAEIVGGR
ncbi:hypothetical protein AB6802_18965 [Mesorhizobium sp. RCC_202]|uniref:hypothetical protein n=1 Tax=Mesorhizobium sp. RCC_202 TaxID=3239222 RepID=UPI0035251CF4